MPKSGQAVRQSQNGGMLGVRTGIKVNYESETTLSDPSGISEVPESRNRAEHGQESENQECRIGNHKARPAEDLLAGCSLLMQVELKGKAVLPRRLSRLS